jgi:hypothetical protein
LSGRGRLRNPGLIAGPGDDPGLELLFFPICLGGSETRLFAVFGATVVLVEQPANDPDLFSAKEAEHDAFFFQPDHTSYL